MLPYQPKAALIQTIISLCDFIYTALGLCDFVPVKFASHHHDTGKYHKAEYRAQ